MPAVLALRDALYTPSFRQFVADITGVNDLTDRVDCSINAYGKCFLGLWGREGREKPVELFSNLCCWWWCFVALKML